jgi:hypothetical protein
MISKLIDASYCIFFNYDKTSLLIPQINHGNRVIILHYFPIIDYLFTMVLLFVLRGRRGPSYHVEFRGNEFSGGWLD